MFLDCVPIKVNSAWSDESRRRRRVKGKPLDGERVLLVMVTSSEGLPLGFDVLPDTACAGQGLALALNETLRRSKLEQAVCVGDRNWLDDASLAAIDESGQGYLVDALPRLMPEELHSAILDLDSYRPMEELEEVQVKELEHEGRRIFVFCSAERVARDVHLRRDSVNRLRCRVRRGGDPKGIGQRAKQFISKDSKGGSIVDKDKIAESERWEGFEGYVTNQQNLRAVDALAHHRGLRQLEYSFRVTRHDLRVRPIFQWTPELVRAHVAIAFIACACERQLACRLAKMQYPMSRAAIQETLSKQMFLLYRIASGSKRYCKQLSGSEDEKHICKASE